MASLRFVVAEDRDGAIVLRAAPCVNSTEDASTLVRKARGAYDERCRPRRLTGIKPVAARPRHRA